MLTLSPPTLGENVPELATAIHDLTGGWPAAVRLGVDSLLGIPSEMRPSVLELLNGFGGRLSTYLAEEVFAAESPSTRLFLQRLAAIGGADRELCGAVGCADPAVLLSDLTRRGLVVFTQSPGESWSPIAPLRDHIRGVVPLPEAPQTTLHRRAAAHLVERGRHERALRHLREAGDHAAVAGILVDHGTRLVSAGELDAVITAAELPSDHLDDPRLQWIVGHARHVRGMWAGAEACFTQAGGERTTLHPALAWRMGLLAQDQGRFQEALELYGRAELANEDTADEALLLSWTAIAHRMTGDYADARRYAARATAASHRCDDPAAKAAACVALALLAAAEGDHAGTDACTAGALQSARVGDDVLELIRVRVHQSFHLVKHGQLLAGFDEAQTALEMSGRVGYRLQSAIALTSRGIAQRTFGRLREATGDFGTARDLLQNLGSRYLAWPLCGLGDVQRVRGELATARATFEEALALAEASGDVIGLGAALIGLAQVRAADDLDLARALADRAAGLNEGLHQVQVLLTRGWVELMAGDRPAARRLAQDAVAAAGQRRDMPGLAEALLLTVMSSPEPGCEDTLLEEVLRRWHDIGNPIEEATARLVAARLAGREGRTAARAAQESLLGHGVKVGAGCAAGPLALLPSPAGRRIAIRALGRFEVRLDGRAVPASVWRSKKARDLLKILVARRGRPVAREELMDLLWPRECPAKAGNRLSVLLSTLRSVLHTGPDCPNTDLVIADRAAVRLDIEHVEVDVEDFLNSARDAIAADRSGRPDAVARLAAAESRYTGQFLESDSSPEWAEQLREETQASYTALVRRLSERLRDAGDIDQAIQHTLRLLEFDCYDEGSHLGLIGTLLTAGRHGEARRRYRLYVKRMRDIAVAPRPWPITPAGDRPSSAMPSPAAAGVRGPR